MPKFKVNQDMEEETTDYNINDMRRFGSTPTKYRDTHSDSQMPIADYFDKHKKKAEKYSFRNSRKQGIMEGIETNLQFYTEKELRELSSEIEKIIKKGIDLDRSKSDKENWRTQIGKSEYLTKISRKLIGIIARKDSY